MTVGSSIRHTKLSRPRLIERLNRALDLPLTLIAAPAGAGKTTLISSWAETCSSPTVWLSLVAGDDALDDFLRLLVATIQARFPEFGRSTLALLNGATLPPAHTLAASLAAELADLSQAVVVIIDDYEVVVDVATHEFMRALLPRLPSAIHLVIASRRIPPFPMARLRAQGALLDVSAADLRFDRPEAQALLEQAAGHIFAPEVVDEALRQTEGWAVALHLIGLALRDEANPSKAIDALSASSRSEALAFFLEEVYSQQPPAVQDMLLKTSILERLTPSLCEAVAGNVSGEWTGRAFVDWLASTHLLMTPVADNDDIWFRYHSLLRTALQVRLRATARPGDIETLQRRAAAWFEQAGLVDEAIAQFVAAGAVDDAVRLVEGSMLALIAEEDWLRMEHWLRLLPPDRVASSPVLLIGDAWSVFLRQGHGFLQARFEKIEQFLQAPDTNRTTWSKAGIRAGLAALAAPMEWMSGNAEAALTRAGSARLAVDASFAPLDGWAVCNTGIALHLTDRRDAALSVLQTSLADGVHRNEPGMVSRSLFGLAYVHWLRADLANMESDGLRLLEIFSRSGQPIGRGWAHFFLGAAYYEWNRLAEARQHLEVVVDHRHEVNHSALRGSIFTLALINDLEGTPQAADALLDGLKGLAWDTTNLATLRLLASFRAQRAARYGDIAEASRWLAEAQPTPERGPMVFTEIPQLTQARLLVARGSREAAREAIEHLAHLEQLALAFSNTPRLVEVLALTALAQRRLGHEEEAGNRLARAVRLGQPGRFTRTFLDLGPDMASLLRRWTPDSGLLDYVAYLLAQFASSPSLQLAADRIAVRQSQAQSRLIEPLSPRELEILALLVERLSYQEIAHRLVISPRTVKTHAHHIYEKLAVSSRAEAIEKAQRLGLLAVD